jgi:hypothetical protein
VNLLVLAELAYNNLVQESTKTTPFKATFRDNIKLRLYKDS